MYRWQKALSKAVSKAVSNGGGLMLHWYLYLAMFAFVLLSFLIAERIGTT